MSDACGVSGASVPDAVMDAAVQGDLDKVVA